MAGRVFEYKPEIPDDENPHKLWFEVSEDRWILGSSWKDIALYFGGFVGRRVQPASLKYTEARESFGADVTEEVSS